MPAHDNETRLMPLQLEASVWTRQRVSHNIGTETDASIQVIVLTRLTILIKKSIEEQGSLNIYIETSSHASISNTGGSGGVWTLHNHRQQGDEGETDRSDGMDSAYIASATLTLTRSSHFVSRISFQAKLMLITHDSWLHFSTLTLKIITCKLLYS